MCRRGAVDGEKRPLGRVSKQPIRGGGGGVDVPGSERLAPFPSLRPTLGSMSPCSPWRRPGPLDNALMDLRERASCRCGQWEKSGVMDRL